MIKTNFLVFCFLLSLQYISSGGSPPPLPPAPTVYTIQQKFDHFNSSDSRTFTQRILVYDKDFLDRAHLGAKRPVFFCPGGESNALGGYNHNGAMFVFGKELGALQIFPEHRFYGDSVPFGLDSYSAENVNKLTIQQALEDYAVVSNWVINKYNISKASPWIAFGGSYPGDLTAYMRVGYPHIIDAGLASSAPLVYHSGEAESGAFFATVTADFALGSDKCPALFLEASKKMMEMSPQQVQNALRLCSVESDYHLINLWIENAFAELGMGNYPWASPPYPVAAACQKFLASGATVEGIADAVGLAYNSTGNLKCFNISDEYFPCADRTGCGSVVTDAKSWDYQSCTQIVSNIGTNGKSDMFIPYAYNFTELSEYCATTWYGAIPKPYEIPKLYDYKKGSRLILSSGTYDPWFGGCVLSTDPKSENIVVIIPNAAHHLDLRGPSNVDPPYITMARKLEWEVIYTWVGTIFEEKKAKFGLFE